MNNNDQTNLTNPISDDDEPNNYDLSRFADFLKDFSDKVYGGPNPDDAPDKIDFSDPAFQRDALKAIHFKRTVEKLRAEEAASEEKRDRAAWALWGLLVQSGVFERPEFGECLSEEDYEKMALEVDSQKNTCYIAMQNLTSNWHCDPF